MPLYFMQARTMIGDIVAMAPSPMAFAGFGIAAFDRRPQRRDPCRMRGLWRSSWPGSFRGFHVPRRRSSAWPSRRSRWASRGGSFGLRAAQAGDLRRDRGGGARSSSASWRPGSGSRRFSRATPSEYSVWLGAQSRPSPSFRPSISSFTISATRSFRGAPSSPLRSGVCSDSRSPIGRETRPKAPRRAIRMRDSCASSVRPSPSASIR